MKRIGRGLVTLLALGIVGASFGGCQWKRSNAEPSIPVEQEAPEEKAAVRPLRLMQFSLIFMNARYVDPERIHWKDMVIHAVDALQNMVPEVVAKFDRRMDDHPNHLSLRVGRATREYEISSVTSLSRAYQVSEDIYNFVLDHLLEPKDAQELEYAMINGMFSTLDPHTNLLPPYAFEDVMTGNGGFAGCGFVVGVRDENLVVISPMEGTPAWKAGIKAGDVIVRIDDESTENMPLQDAVDRMRGEVGSQVTLYVKRRGWVEPKPIVITRELIRIKSVTSHAFEGDKIGYIKIKSFDQTTAQEVKAHLAQLRDGMKGLRGLIIDLRNNSGGLLTQSIAISEMFLNKGDTIVAVEGATPEAREETRAMRDGAERGYPIVVLINVGSASASEIVSGALQYHERATVIGQRSFGKGSVQILKDNPDGSAIKVTSAQYLTPGDISIQGVGIVPDIELVPSFVSDEGVSLIESRRDRRESTLEQSLRSSKTTHRESARSLHYLYVEAQEDEARAKELGLSKYDLRSTEDYTPDDEIDFARRYLTRARSNNAVAVLAESLPFFDEEVSRYTRELSKAFKKQNIDWGASENASCESLSWGIKFGNQTAVGEGKIRFPADGKEHQLVMWVKNPCENRELTQLSASLFSNNIALDEREFAFGRILPGEKREWAIKVKIPRSMAARDDEVYVEFYQNGEEFDTGVRDTFHAQIAANERPEFSYTYWIDDIARGNGDGKLSRNESADMYLRVKNIGRVKSDRVNIHLANESGSGVLLVQGRGTIENLEPGASALVKLQFDMSQDRPQKPPSKRIKRDKPFNPDEAVFRLTIADDAYDTAIEQDISFPVLSTPWTGTPKTREPMEVRAGSVLVSSLEEKEALTLGAFPRDTRVEGVWLTPTQAAVCWKEGALNPCAFAPKSAIVENRADSKARAPKVENASQKFMPEFHFEAPRIVFLNREHTIHERQAKIDVLLTDNDGLNDYEAYVWSQDGLKVKVEKLAFDLLDGLEKRLSIDVPLRSGDNSLVIVSRDKHAAESVGIFHINRSGVIEMF